MTRIAIGSAFVALAMPLAAAMAQTLSPTPVFEATTTTLATNGAAQPVNVSVQLWEIAGQKGVTREIPLHGFYVAHLLSGAISATIDGRTTTRLPGAYWTVKAGATMQVQVLGEFAVLETTVVGKQ